MTVLPGSGARKRVGGWIAVIDTYSDEGAQHVLDNAMEAYETIFGANLDVNRTVVSVYSRPQAGGARSGRCLYSVLVDRGKQPVVLQEYTPP